MGDAQLINNLRHYVFPFGKIERDEEVDNPLGIRAIPTQQESEFAFLSFQIGTTNGSEIVMCISDFEMELSCQFIQTPA